MALLSSTLKNFKNTSLFFAFGDQNLVKTTLDFQPHICKVYTPNYFLFRTELFDHANIENHRMMMIFFKLHGWNKITKENLHKWVDCKDSFYEL